MLKGTFSVNSFYTALTNTYGALEIGGSFRILQFLLDCWSFVWITRREKLLTVDILRRQNHFFINGCPRDEEMVNSFILSLLVVFGWLFLLV